MNRPSPPQFPPFSGPGFRAEPTEHPIEPSRDALPPGTQLAEYEVLSVLREGGFGIVYLAADHALRRQVAIKEYLPAALAFRGHGPEVTLRSDAHAETFAAGLESFVNEARLLARFDHPALMRVYRFWEANHTAYMVMPHYEGVTLDIAREAMARPPDEAWLRGLLLPLLGALDVLHSASCYHREISPENILLLPDGRPVLVDFGATRHIVGDRDHVFPVIHNPAFAPIEQYSESTTLRQGPWTNLYALAAVAYYCVSGRAPVASTVRVLDEQMEPLFQVVDRLGSSFPELNYSVALVSAIDRALNVRPPERPQSVAEFRRALLGGQGAAEYVAVPPAVEEVEPHRASPPPLSYREETGPMRAFPSASDGGNVKDAFWERSKPWQPEAGPTRQAAPAWEARTRSMPPPGHTPRGSVDDVDDAAPRAALDDTLRADPNDFGGSLRSADANPSNFGRSPQPRRDAKAGGWRRTLFMVVAAVALVALGAGGWMLWLDHRDTEVLLRSLALGTKPQARSAPLLPPEPPATVVPQPPAESPAPTPSGEVAEPQLLPPGTAAPEAGTVEPPPEEAAAVTETPAELPAPAPSGEAAEPQLLSSGTAATEAGTGEPPPEEAAAVAETPAESPREEAAPVAETPAEPPAVAEEAPSPPPPAEVVEKEPDNPRELCGPRTQFSLYRCMQNACDRSKYFDHPECKYLRATDEVRASW